MERINTKANHTDFILKLNSNPTTGHKYIPKFDNAYIKLVTTQFKVSDPNKIGAGGVDTFIFRGLKTGNTKLVMQYVGPTGNIAKTIEYSVVID